VSVKENVKKDWSQLDDLDDFWAEEESTRRLQLSYHTDAIAGDQDQEDEHEDEHEHEEDSGSHGVSDAEADEAVNQRPEEEAVQPVEEKKKKKTMMIEEPLKSSPVVTRKEKLEQLDKALGIVSLMKPAPHSALKRLANEAEGHTENNGEELTFSLSLLPCFLVFAAASDLLLGWVVTFFGKVDSKRRKSVSFHESTMDIQQSTSLCLFFLSALSPPP